MSETRCPVYGRAAGLREEIQFGGLLCLISSALVAEFGSPPSLRRPPVLVAYCADEAGSTSFLLPNTYFKAGKMPAQTRSPKMQPFRLTEKRSRAGCLEILVEGEIDLAVADQLEQALARADSQYKEILIGLQDCEFIDSTAIAVIVHAHNRMAAEGRRVAVYGPSSQVHRILSITGLTENGLVFANLDEALTESS